MEKVSYWECVSCGRIDERPFPGRIIEVKLKFCGRVASLECETCAKMVAENSNWIGSNAL